MGEYVPHLVVCVTKGGGVSFHLTQACLRARAHRWNQMDWCIQVVFFTFWGLKMASLLSDINGDYAKAEVLHGYSMNLLAVNSIILWVRMLEYFSIFPSLGPLVQVIGLMLQDMINFSTVYGFILAGFASAFNSWYREITNYSTVWRSMVTLFQASMGEFDYEAFEDSDKKVIGEVTLTIFVGVSAILLLNLCEYNKCFCSQKCPPT